MLAEKRILLLVANKLEIFYVSTAYSYAMARGYSM